ncbi:WD repeat domain-containing protein [Apiospora saccharicola]
MSDDDDFQVEGPELAEDDPMRAFLPTSFGKKSKEADISAQLERSKRPTEKPQLEKGKEVQQRRDSSSEAEKDSDDDDDDSDSDEDEDEYPTSHEMVIKTHDRAVTSVSLDPAGGRLVSGSIDCTVKLHDFTSMTPTTIRAFRSVDPYQTKASAASEAHPIHHVEFNPLAGSVFLCVSAHPQAKIMSRDGDVITEFVKGDMYLRDMNNTKGHVSEITTGTWHPTDKNLCVTAGTDSPRCCRPIENDRGGLGAPAQGGSNVLVSAALDGTLVMWSGNGPWSRPAAEIRDAHKANTWTGGVDISSDGRMVVTRGGDNLIKLWDTRKFKEPLVTVDHPSTSDHYPMTTIKYGPNSASIITGSATGHLHILNPGNLSAEYTTPVTPGKPLVTVNWHPKINQIVTGSANGETHILYNPSMSTRGAKDVMSRAPKKRHVDDDPEFTTDQSLGLSGDAIVAPGQLQGSRKAGVTASGRSKDPRRPQVQQITPFMRNQPDSKHVSENIPLSKMLYEDPREALLKYADLAKKDPKFTGAYADTQPVTQYAEVSDDEDEGPDKKRVKR